MTSLKTPLSTSLTDSGECQEISRTNHRQLVRYNIVLQEDVHPRTSIDGGKPIAQFLNVIECVDSSLILKSDCYFGVPVE